jgi:hypothetical protein
VQSAQQITLGRSTRLGTLASAQTKTLRFSPRNRWGRRVENQPLRTHSDLGLGVNRQGDLEGISEPRLEVADELETRTELAMHRSP